MSQETGFDSLLANSCASAWGGGRQYKIELNTNFWTRVRLFMVTSAIAHESAIASSRRTFFI